MAKSDKPDLAHRVENLIRIIKDSTLEIADTAKAQLEWFRSNSSSVTKSDLNEMENRLMSAISDFAAKQKAFNDRQAAAIDSLVTSTEGLTGDVKALNDKITELQNSPGAITPEDQALLDDLQTQGEATAAKVEGVATALSALDSQTPPVVPTP